MTSEGRRKLRVLFKFGLLVSLPLTGYLWAMPNQSSLSLGVMVMTALSVVMALGAEGLASVAESELSQLKAKAVAEDKQWNSEIAGRDEKIRQMDRIIETLSNQNHDLRGKLVSVHGEMHRLREEIETEKDAGDAREDFDGAGSAGSPARDVTEIKPRRSHR